MLNGEKNAFPLRSGKRHESLFNTVLIVSYN